MLELYLGCLIVGGILVGASMLAGGHDSDNDGDADGDGDADHDHDHDHDHDADGDADHDHDHDHDADGDADHDHDVGGHAAGHVGPGSVADAAAALHAGPGRKLWLPFLSFRFWTFFLAFFGLTGAVLSGFGLMAAIPTLITALALGGGSGTGIAFAIHRLKQHQVGAASGPLDFLGREATVVLRIGPGRTGKIRMLVRDEVLELLAEADEEIARGEKVLVFEMEGAVARVARALESRLPPGQLPPASS